MSRCSPRPSCPVVIVSTAQLRPVKILPNVEYRPLQRLICLRTIFLQGDVVVGVEEFGVAVGGEGDGTGEFNGTPNYKAYLSRDFFIFKSPYLMLQLSIITNQKISLLLPAAWNHYIETQYYLQ